jgi:hypothetical protein
MALVAGAMHRRNAFQAVAPGKNMPVIEPSNQPSLRINIERLQQEVHMHV